MGAHSVTYFITHLIFLAIVFCHTRVGGDPICMMQPSIEAWQVLWNGLGLGQGSLGQRTRVRAGHGPAYIVAA